MTQNHQFRVEIEPAPKGLTELQRLTDELIAIDGWEVKRHLDGIHRTWSRPIGKLAARREDPRALQARF